MPPRPPGRTVFRGGSVFDGTGSQPTRADVAIEGETIREVGLDLAGDHVIDVAGSTVMPGLIDCHAHPAFPGAASTLDDDVERSPTFVAYEALAGLRATLDAGVTTVRDAAGADAGIRRAVAEGLIPGPRLLISLIQLSPSAGPYDGRSPSGFDTWIPRPGIPSPVADGADELRTKVRELAQAGADVVKIFASGHFAMPRDGALRSMFTDAELAAIVDEANHQGIRVMAHAHGPVPAAAAARAGVASIEHGFFLDDVALTAMRDAGTVFVPTLLASAGVLEAFEGTSAERAEATVRAHRAAVRAAHAMGITIALGTDCPVTPHGRNAEELQLLVECGLSPWEALAAGTSVAARLLDLDAEIGRVTPGHRADLLVVRGDLADVSFFRSRLEGVYQGGVRVGPTAPP
ncbi:MAG TPA: amidohydrolase family protein [Candidatus Limnocylindrales bacterium]|nr:amidohydrolase family protein [Candidatus Limnocylindrales bacterium]